MKQICYENVLDETNMTSPYMYETKDILKL